MRKAKKVYMFRTRPSGNWCWERSKMYVSAYHCQQKAEKDIKKGYEVELYEAEVKDWKLVKQIYNNNSIKEQIEENSAIVTFPEPKQLV